MANITLTIDNKQVTGREGQTILEIARANGIQIPTLCEDSRLEHYGGCALCMIETGENQKLLRACATPALAGMAIRTDTPRVRKSRKATLELLLSDHTGDCRAPCMLACPAGTDCQGYVGLIANGEYQEAAKLIMEKIPLPASIGRVCPHPCENACRRKLAEEPVAIAALKQFAGDLALNNPCVPATAQNTGKKIAIIGGGPGGLTAAYFLRSKGHHITVYDAMPQMGGMLRYGIPEYRLPNAILQKEIDLIEQMGVVFQNNVSVGKDLTLEQLRGTYDAVVVAVGAWTSAGLRCPGEALDGVVGGIEFLREIDVKDLSSKRTCLGKNIAVVGGGNTAMDACRTSVRLGAANVYNIYRRTKNEMPAEAIEIAEAEEEGVVFKNLTNPIEILGENGRVSALRLQVMALGEPDASGRRSPVAVPGKEEVLAVDHVIVAIGQKTNAKGFEALNLTRWGTIMADERTFQTNLPDVFAIGDATNNGAGIAIEAIGEAKKAADMIDKYLHGELLEDTPKILVRTEKTEEDFADQEKQPRVRMPHRRASERRRDFREVNLGFSEEDAKHEAMRCLECGCMQYFDCGLLAYMNEYQASPDQYAGVKKCGAKKRDTHPHLRRDPAKCILCGLCVRVCEQAVGAAALGHENRGFDTVTKPPFDLQMEDSGCLLCGACADVCPTGALVLCQGIAKQVPLQEEFTPAVCTHCELSCKMQLSKKGGLVLRCLPAEKNSLLCAKGRFGFGEHAPLPERPQEAQLLEIIKNETESMQHAP